MKHLIVTVVALVAVAQATRDWSKIKPKHLHVMPRMPAIAPKIVGGIEVEGPGGVPFQAAVISSSGAFCGGSIIRDDAVLTAAHCVDGASSAEIIGDAHRIFENEDQQQIIQSREIRVHENWDPFRISDDIAVILLSKKLELHKQLQPVKLNTDTASLEGEEGLVSGWGRYSDESGSLSEVLLATVDKIISNQECQKSFGSYVTKNNICLNGSNGRGACNGDSGGPLTVADGNEGPYPWKQVGIVSFGSGAGCQKGHPSVFTRVSEYVSWIEQQLN